MRRISLNLMLAAVTVASIGASPSAAAKSRYGWTPHFNYNRSRYRGASQIPQTPHITRDNYRGGYGRYSWLDFNSMGYFWMGRFRWGMRPIKDPVPISQIGNPAPDDGHAPIFETGNPPSDNGGQNPFEGGNAPPFDCARPGSSAPQGETVVFEPIGDIGKGDFNPGHHEDPASPGGSPFDVSDGPTNGPGLTSPPTGSGSPQSPTIQAGVPEPAAWSMMIAGFGLIGGALRSRRRDAEPTSLRYTAL